MLPAMSLSDQVSKVAQRLADEYAGQVPDPEVRRLIDEAYHEMESATVTQFVPVLIDRSVRRRLRERQSA
jgi:hypothetical protein